MKTAIFKEPGTIVVEQTDKPTINNQSDAIVNVIMTCVCGSDLWYYKGVSDKSEGSIGHEFIGIVDQIGTDVDDIKIGDFVIAPFAYSDGVCVNCVNGVQTACRHGGFFGGDTGMGGQAEYVRVPYADTTLTVIDAHDVTEQNLPSLLTLTDVMGTGYHAAVSAEVKPGDTVAVVGDGAVGLCGVLSAKMLGAEKIIVLGSHHEDRHQLARKWGATEIITARGEEAIQKTFELTGDQGADAVLECVGTQDSIDTSIAIARAGSTIGRVGISHDAVIDTENLFYRNIGLKGGPAPVKEYMDILVPAVLEGKITPGEVFNDQFDLSEVSQAYEAMDRRTAIKSLLKVTPFPFEKSHSKTPQP